MKLGEACKRFDQFLASERRVSPLTKKAYMRDLSGLVHFLKACGPGQKEWDLVELDIYLLRSHLSALAKTLSPQSVARHISSLRSFFDFLQKKNG